MSVFVFAVALTSCEADKVVYDVDNGQSLVGFNAKTGAVPAYLDAEKPAGYDNSVAFEIGSSVRSGSARTFTVTVNDEFTTAIPSQYAISSTYTIPAGQFIGTLDVESIYDALPSDYSSVILVLDLTEVSGSGDVIYNADTNRLVVTLNRGCTQTPASEYTGYISSSVGSGAAPFTVTLTPVEGVFNTWNADNIWGDLVAAATGSDSYLGMYPYPAQIKINCDNTVNVYGTASYGTTSGNSGTYNRSSKEMTLNFGQDLFSSAFTTTVDLYPNN